MRSYTPPTITMSHSEVRRVIYYWWVADSLITLADIYSKNEKENISAREIEALRKQIEGE